MHKLLPITLLGFSLSSLATDITLDFSGVVKQSSCEINSGTLNQEINMGQIKLNQFNGPGTTVNQRHFTLKLTGCQGVAAVDVYMTGVPDSDNSDYFSLTNDSEQATGVALSISTMDGMLHKPQGNIVTTPINEDNEKWLNYIVSYVQTKGTVTAGKANSIADYTVVYK